MIKQKLQAATFHLLLSVFIVGAFLIFVINVWYPQPFLSISGLQSILLLLISIDIILGPILTFIVFKPQKKTLKFDLSVIAAIQLAALVYGAHTIYAAHPLYVAYAIDRFSLIHTHEVSPAKARYPELQKSTFAGPSLVYVKKPSDPAELSRVTMEVLSGKPDLDARPEYYEPFQQFVDQVLASGIKPEQLIRKAKHKQKLDDFLKKHGGSTADYAFLALSGKEKDVIWVFKRSSKQAIDILDINPWQLGKT